MTYYSYSDFVERFNKDTHKIDLNLITWCNNTQGRNNTFAIEHLLQVIKNPEDILNILIKLTSYTNNINVNKTWLAKKIDNKTIIECLVQTGFIPQKEPFYKIKTKDGTNIATLVANKHGYLPIKHLWDYNPIWSNSSPYNYCKSNNIRIKEDLSNRTFKPYNNKESWITQNVDFRLLSSYKEVEDYFNQSGKIPLNDNHYKFKNPAGLYISTYLCLRILFGLNTNHDHNKINLIIGIICKTNDNLIINIIKNQINKINKELDNINKFPNEELNTCLNHFYNAEINMYSLIIKKVKEYQQILHNKNKKTYKPIIIDKLYRKYPGIKQLVNQLILLRKEHALIILKKDEYT